MKNFLFALVLAGCQTARTTPALAETLTAPKFPLLEKATLRFSTDAGNHVGIAVLKRQAFRKFTFEIPKNATELYIDTCHREVSAYHPAVSFVWTYLPVLALQAPEPIEYAGNCPLILTVVGQRGNVLRAIVSFSGDEDSPADLYCNGVQTATVGHTLCQAKAMPPTVQAIVFPQPMHATWTEKCPPLRTNDNRGFAWDQGLGVCIYAFNSFDKTKTYRLMTHGFSVVPMPDYSE